MATAATEGRTTVDLRDLRPLRSGLRFLCALWVAQWPAATALTAAVLLQGVLPAARLWVLGRLVNGIAAAIGGTAGPPLGDLALLVGAMAAQSTLGLVVEALEETLRDRATQGLQRQLLEKAASLDLAFFEQEASYDRLQRATRATDMELATFYSSALQPIQSLVTALALAATLATAAWWLGPLLLLAALPVLWLKLQRTAHQFAWKIDETPIERRRGYFQRLLYHRESAKEVRLFGLGGHLLQRWEEQQLALQRGHLRQAAAEARVSMASEGALFAALAAATLLLAFHVAGGTLSLGAYVMLAQAATELQGAVDAILVGLRGAYLRALSADDVFAFLDQPTEGAATEAHGPSGAVRAGGPGQAPPGQAHGAGLQRAAAGTGDRGQEPAAAGADDSAQRGATDAAGANGGHLAAGAPPRGPAASTPLRAPWTTRGTPQVGAAGRPFPLPLRAGIRFEDVWFRYRSDAPWTLQGISFAVHAGETVALVGENGAGKTTLVKLLLGLYRPVHGRILYDGVPLTDLDPADLRRHCSAIFQDFAQFQLTLRESIGIGDTEPLLEGGAVLGRARQPAGRGRPWTTVAADAIPSAARAAWDRRVERAAERAGADAVAAGLPQGYDTVLSPAFGGVDLSGGQWQKVALARSLMRAAEVLVLDEPTASLDPRAELAVFTAFRALATGRTTFLISHRIGTARLADRILVLRAGRLCETGSHAELLQAAGDYAALFAAQRQWYAAEAEGGLGA